MQKFIHDLKQSFDQQLETKQKELELEKGKLEELLNNH
jgi:hypothetical protein